MTLLTCRAVTRRLAAFHDRELPVPELIAIEAHVHDCPPCALGVGVGVDVAVGLADAVGLGVAVVFGVVGFCALQTARAAL